MRKGRTRRVTDRRIAAFVCTGVAVGLLAGGWFGLALQRFKGLSSDIETRLAPITELSGHLLTPSGEVNDRVSYEGVQALVQSYESGSAAIEGRLSLLEAGGGVQPWLPEARRAKVMEVRSRLERLEALVTEGRLALEALEPAHAEVGKALVGGSSTRDVVSATLNLRSESRDFLEAAASLGRSRQGVDSARRRLTLAADQPLQSQTAQRLSRAMLTDMEASLERERERIKVLWTKVDVAERGLATYQAELAGMLSGTSGVIDTMEEIARRLGPVIAAAYERTEPVRQTLVRLEEPVFGGVAGVAMSFLGGDQGGITPLSLLSADPRMGMAIDAVRGLCDGIAALNQETEELDSMVGTLADAVREYRASPSRETMLVVVSAAPTAAAYCQQKSGIFDPVLERVEDARGLSAGLRDVAARTRIAPVRDALVSCASRVTQMIDFVETPLVRGKRAMLQSVESLSSLQALEDAYAQVVGEIAKHASEDEGLLAAAEPTAQVASAALDVPEAPAGQDDGRVGLDQGLDTDGLDRQSAAMRPEPPVEDLNAVSTSSRTEPPMLVSGDVSPPVLVGRVAPKYPDEAREAGIVGAVILEVVIGASGRVESAEVLKSMPLFDQVAKDAVLQWQYTPATRQGRAVPVYQTVQVEVVPELAPTMRAERNVEHDGPASAPVQQEPRVPLTPATPEVEWVTVSTDATIAVTLESSVSSEGSHEGQSVRAIVARDLGASSYPGTVIPIGTIVEGRITEALRTSESGGARLVLVFDVMRLPSGETVGFHGSFVVEGQNKKRKAGKAIAGGALVGATLGKVFGNKNKDAAVGALAGAAVGAGAAAAWIKPLHLAQGSTWDLQVDRAFEVPVEGSL
jgi:TonB family protein